VSLPLTIIIGVIVSVFFQFLKFFYRMSYLVAFSIIMSWFFFNYNFCIISNFFDWKGHCNPSRCIFYLWIALCLLKMIQIASIILFNIKLCYFTYSKHFCRLKLHCFLFTFAIHYFSSFDLFFINKICGQCLFFH